LARDTKNYERPLLSGQRVRIRLCVCVCPFAKQLSLAIASQVAYRRVTSVRPSVTSVSLCVRSIYDLVIRSRTADRDLRLGEIMDTRVSMRRRVVVDVPVIHTVRSR